MIYDAMVIGAGPAGLTAAIYLKRANLNVAMIEKEAPGGKVTQTSVVENYPGFQNITGTDLALTMYDQVVKLGVPHLYGNVQSVEKKDGIFQIITDLERYEAKRVICATGTISRLLHVPGEDRFYGHGISLCAICDGAFYKGKEVAVIGGGNSAFEESLYLAKIAKHVHIINRSERYRADSILIDEIKANPNITIYNNTTVSEFFGEETLNGIKLHNKVDDTDFTLMVEGVFIYIGFEPATLFLKNLNVLDEHGYLKVNEDLESEVPGLFGAGDCLNKKIRQIATAVGDGALAASCLIRTCHK